LRELVETAVKIALKMGATEAEAYGERTRIFRVDFAENITSMKTTDLLGIGIRAVVGKRTAICSTSAISRQQVERAAERAVRIARVATEDQQWHHLNTEFGYSPADGYCDENLVKLEPKAAIDKIVSATNEIMDYDRRVKPIVSYLSTTVSDTIVANSNSSSDEFTQTNASLSVNSAAEDGDVKNTGSSHCQTRFWKNIAFEKMAEESAQKSLDFLKARAISSRKTSVIVNNKIFANMLGIMLSEPIGASWIREKRSPLIGKLNAQIASENVTITDDGLMYGGWMTKPFDDEGHPTQKTLIVEKGVFRNILYDTYSALIENVESTGNAQRGKYSAFPTPSPSNLILNPGAQSPDDIIQETADGIYVEETIGEWLSDPIGGNLSATITHGHLVENGEKTEPIKGVVLSTDFYSILKNGIVAVGNDISNYTQYYSPTVKLREVAIAGKA
jgi:PmbA protein